MATKHLETQRAIRSLSIIVPLFNEEEAVAHLAKRLTPAVEELEQTWSVQLILVDDGSTDDTYQRLLEQFSSARRSDVSILRHLNNRGIGAAMATGFEAATGDVVCTIDCDCTYAPEKLRDLVNHLLTSGGDIATGSPYHPDGGVDGVKPWRLFISKAASRLYSAISPMKLHCYTSFFRAYRSEWVRTDLFDSEGFLAVAESLVRSARAGAKVVEFPVQLSQRKHGQSKMRVARVAMQHFRLMGKIAFLWPLFPAMAGSKSVARTAGRLGELWEARPSEAEDFGKLLDRWVLVGRVRVGP